MASSLSNLSGTQSQNSTGNPQANAPSINTGTPSGEVQPVPATGSLQNGQTGVLQGTSSLSHLTLIPPSSATKTGTSTAAPAPSPKHHVNAGLISVAVLFCLAAVVLFWLTGRTAKNTV